MALALPGYQTLPRPAWSTLARLELGLGGALVAAYLASPDPVWRAACLFAGATLATLSAAGGVILHRPDPGRPWAAFLAALLLVVAGLGVTLAEVAGAVPPAGYLSDLCYLGAYAATVTGLLTLIRARAPGRDRASLIDAALPAIAVGMPLWVWVIGPRLTSAPDLALGGLYALLDLVLLGIAVRLAVTPGRRSVAFILLLVSLGCLMASDLVALVLRGGPGGYADSVVLALVAYVLWGQTALHPSMRDLAEASREPELRVGGARRLILAGSMLAAPTLSALEGGYHTGAPALPVAVGAAAVSLLCAARLFGLVTSLERVVRERSALHEDLRHREARFRSLIANASDAVVILDAAGRITYESPAAARVLGWDPAERIGRSMADYLHPEDADRVLAVFAELRAMPGSERMIECRARHQDGGWRWIEAVGRNLLDDPDVAGVIANYRDVTEHKTLEARLRHDAHHDALTGLPNRALFTERLETALEAAVDAEREVAVLFIDLDDFKLINDTLGHTAGDHLLLAVAGRLRAAVRDADLVARLGGDEFTVLVEDAAEAVAVADRIQRRLTDPFTLGGRRHVVRASIGIARGAGAGSDLLAAADVAMYAAKETGSARAEFDPTMRERVWTRLDLEAELRTAIEQRQLTLHFQPVVELATGRVASAEALVRWNHPTRGLVPPGEFIGLAEETGLIVPLGRAVLFDACLAAARWQALGHPVGLSVNVSPRQLGDEGLLDDVREALGASGVRPEQLTLELTETAGLPEEERVEALLRALEGLGVRLALDDFGTGYSGLATLRRPGFAGLKIDRSFVAALGTSAQADSLARAGVALGRALGLSVTAEGIEQAEQLRVLRELGCEYGQGYGIAPPAAIEPFVAWLAEGPRLAIPEAAA